MAPKISLFSCRDGSGARVEHHHVGGFPQREEGLGVGAQKPGTHRSACRCDPHVIVIVLNG